LASSFGLSGERLEARMVLTGAALEAPSLFQPPVPAPVVMPIWFQSLAPDVSAATLTQDEGPEWIVQLSPSALVNINSPSDAIAFFQPAGVRVVRGLGLAGQLLVESTGQPKAQVEQWLAANPGVASFEEDVVLAAAVVPNDPSFSQIWGLNNTGQTLGLADADLDAPEAWEITRGSASVVVGVIDTGVDYTHVDLAANMWRNPGEIADNGFDDDANGFVDDVFGYDFANDDSNPQDDNGHGTHVSGTIAAVGNNGVGVTGVNWTSSIMALKFLDSSGRGSTDAAVRAVNYVTMMRTTYGVNVRVTNNSWGGKGSSTALYDAIAANRNADILFVAAAGNDSGDTDLSPNYPAAYDLNNIVSVAATDHQDALAWFSSYGANTVDLAAPGVNVLSTWPGNAYSSVSGTSMASPHVAGVAALAWAHSPLATSSQIKDAILAGADRIASLAGDSVTGGRSNARRTLDMLRMNVRSSNPASGSVVTAAPTKFTIDFTHELMAGSVQPSDLLINGTPATSLVFADADTAVFQFATSPVVAQGPQAMLIVEGTILRALDGAPLERWQQSFYYDATSLAVASATPSEAQVVTAPTAIVLDFSEAVAPQSIDINDLALDFGTVTAATALDANTVRYTVSGLVREGLVRYKLAAGAVTDAFGSPSGAYSGQFRTDDPEIETYVASNVPVSIADQARTLATLVVTDQFPLADLDVEIALLHSNVGDLELTLIAPDGSRIELATHVGGSGDNFVGLVLDDEANHVLADAGAPFTGRFRPAESLVALDGFNVHGTWTLEIIDGSPGHAGTLTHWAIVAARDTTIAPRINSVQPLPAEGGKTWLPIDVLTVRFSEDMDEASLTSAANWKLAEAGADGNFDTSDDTARTLSIAPYTGGLTATLNVGGGALAPGKYRFTALSGGLRDVAGNLLDGNADGVGGDAYSRVFFVQGHVSAIPFVEDFESGSLAPPNWEFYADERGRVRIDSSLPHGGTSGLILETLIAYARPQTATLHLDLEGRSGLNFDFWQRHFGAATASPEDSVAFSADGLTWHTLVNLDDYTKLAYQHFSFNLDAAVAAAGITYTRNFHIRFSQDNTYYGAGGYAFDDIRLSQNDFTGPRIVAHAPMVTAGPVSPLTVTFNEPIDPTTFTAGDVTIATPSGTPVSIGAPVNSGDGRTFTIPLLSPQVVAGDYAFHIGPNILDLAGNAMNQDDDTISGEAVQDDYDGILTIGPPASQTIPYVQGFETSLVIPGWRFGTVAGLIEVTSAGIEHGGNQHLMFTAANSTSVGTREAVLVLDLSAYASATNLALEFWASRSSSASGLQLALSGDGVAWTTVVGNEMLSYPNVNVYLPIAVDLDAQLNLAGIIRDGAVYVRLQNTSANQTTVSIDDLRVGVFDAFGPQLALAPASGTTTSFTVTFNEDIDPATFTASDVIVTGPTGNPVSLVGNPVALDARTFKITLQATVSGTYTWQVGPDVRDLAGNKMNQDGDAMPGENGHDDYNGTYVLTLTGPAPVPYFQDFEAADLTQLAGVSFSTTGARPIELTDLFKPHSGTRHLQLTEGNAVTFAVDLSSQTQNTNLGFDFWAQAIAPAIFESALALSVSGNGINFVTVPQASNFASIYTDVYAHYGFDLDQILAAAGVVLDGDVYVRISHPRLALMTLDAARFTTTDVRGPYVVSADLIGTGDSFTVTFDRAIDPTTFTAANIVLAGPVGEPLTLVGDPVPGPDGRTFTLTVPPGLPGQINYSFSAGVHDVLNNPLPISPVRDLAGVPLNQDRDIEIGEYYEDDYRGTYQRNSTPGQALPYLQSFDGSTLALPGVSYGATGSLLPSTTSALNTPHSGDGHLRLTPGPSGRQWVNLKLDLSNEVGATNLGFDFWAKLIGNNLSFSFFVSGNAIDYTWHQPFTGLTFPTSGQYTHFAFDLDEILTSNGIAFDEDVYLRLEFGSASANQIMTIDDLRVSTVDQVGPRVLSQTQSSSTNFEVKFNDPVDPASFTAADVSIISPTGYSVGVIGNPVASADLRTYTITTAANVPGRYSLQIGPLVSDQAGNLMNQDADWINGEASDAYLSTIELFPPVAQSVPVTQGFEGSNFMALPGWTFDSSGAKVDLIGTSNPHGGTRHLKFQAGSSPGRAILKLDLTPSFGATNLSLDFWLQAIAQQSDMSLAVSGDGVNWTNVPQGLDLVPSSFGQYVRYTYDLDQALTAASITFDSSVFVRFMHEGSSLAEMTLDDVRVVAGDPFGPKVNTVIWPGTAQALQVTFNKPIDPTTFTAADLIIINPLGVIEPAGAPTTSDNRTFLVSVGNLVGSYRVVVGPNVLDAEGNAMNQDGDPRPGEANDDDFEITLQVGASVAQALPYLQSFDDDTLALPGWSYATTAVGIIETSSLNAPHSGARHLQLGQSASSTEQAVVKLDLSPFTGASNLTLDFWLKAFGSTSGTFTVAAGTNGTTWTPLPQGSIALSGVQGTYSRFAFDLDAALSAIGIPVGGTVYLRFMNSSSVATAVIDDLRVGQFDVLGPRVASMTTSGSQNNFSIAFDKAVEASTLLPALSVIGPAGSPVAILGQPVAASDLKSFTFTLADDLTGRYTATLLATVRDLVGNLLNQDGDLVLGETNGQDQFSSTYTIGPPVAQTIPYLQSFEVASLNNLPGWSFSTTGAATLALTSASPHSGANQLLFDRASTGTPAVQLALDLAAAAARTDLELDFWLTTFNTTTSANSITVGVSGNGASFTNIANAVSLRAGVGGTLQFGFDLDAALASAGIQMDHDVYVQFLHNGTGATHETGIDDVRVGYADVFGPRVQSVPATVTSSTFTVTFNEPIDPATFTAADVSITAADGLAVSLVGDPAPSADFRTFTLNMAAMVPGAYLVIIAADVRDFAGNLLNQDTDAFAGESSDDRYGGSIRWQAPAVQTVPFTQSFEVAALGDLPGWSFGASNSNQMSLSTSPVPHSGTKQLKFDQFNSPVNTKYAEVKLDLSSVAGQTDLVLDFWLQSTTVFTSTSSMSVLVSGDGVTYTAVPSMAGLKPQQKDLYTQCVMDLDAALAAASISLDQDVYVRFQHFASDSTNDMFIDDVRVSQLPLLGPRVISSSIDLERVVINFDGPIDLATISSTDLTIIGPTGYPVALFGEPSASADRRTFTFTPATHAPGTYTYRLAAQIADPQGNLMNQDGDGFRGETNGDDDYSASLSAPAIATVRVFPYVEGFETDSLGTIPDWSYSVPSPSLIGTVTGSAHSGNYALKFEQPSGSLSSKIATVRLDMSEYHGVRNLTLDFWLKTLNSNSNNRLTVSVSADGNQFSAVSQGSNLQPPALNQYAHFAFDLDAVLTERHIPLDRDVYVRFTHIGNSGNTMVLDDLRLGTADVLGPRVTKSSTGVTAGLMTVTFDEPIDPATFTVDDVVITNAGGQPVTGVGQPLPTGDGRVYTIALPAGASGTYSLRIGPDVRDLAGNLMNQDIDPLVGESNGQDDYESTFSFTGDAAIGQSGPILLSANGVLENASGAAIGAVSREGSIGTVWSVSDARFEIVGTTLKLKEGLSLNYEFTPSLIVTVFANDSAGSASRDFTILVSNVNEAPTAINLSGGPVAENELGATVGTVSAADDDAGDTHTWRVDDARFEIVGTLLKLKAGEALDAEAGNPTIRITATDSGGLSRSQLFVINVINVNEAPTALNLSNPTVLENAPGATVGNVTVFDPDVGSTHAIAVSDNRFEVVAPGVLRLKAGQSLDREATPTINLTLTATDAGGLTRVQSFTINVTNVDEAPTSITLSANSVVENVSSVTIGALTVSDPEGGPHTFVLSDNRFSVMGGNLRLDTPLDFEAGASIPLTITATDSTGLSKAQSVTINVSNSNEPPQQVQLLSFTIEENVVAGVIGVVSYFDPDVADTATWFVSDARFEVVNNQLRLKAGIALDHEAAAPQIQLTVVDAGGLQAASPVYVLTVRNVNEAPTTVGLSATETPENVNGFVIGTISATDPDSANTHTFSVSDNRFSIVGGNQLAVAANGNLDFEVTPSIYVIITATDAGGLAKAQSFTILLQDRNDAPSSLTLSNVTVLENAAGAAIGNVHVTDQDVGATFTYEVDDARFEIVAGTLRLTTSTAINFEAEPTFVVNVQATDNGGLSISRPFIISIVNVNEAPLAIIASGNTLTADLATGTATHVALTVIDPDSADSQTFTVSDSRFEVINNLLKLKAGQWFSSEVSLVWLNVTATDAGGLSVGLPLTVTVLYVNVAPSAVLLSQTHVLENSPGAVVGTVTATDSNSGDVHAFTVNDARFEVIANQLKLKSGIGLDFETTSRLELQVTAVDRGGLSIMQSFAVIVDNTPDAPTDVRLSREKIFNNVAGAWIGDVAVVDQDASNSHAFTVSDARFEVRDRSLFLKPGQTLTEASGTSIPLYVSLQDGAAHANIGKNFNLLVEKGPAAWPFAHQWQPNRYDVNADGFVSPLDALLVIIELNAVGPRELPLASGGTLSPHFFDISGDNSLTPLDALEVINYLNAGGNAEGESQDSFERSVDAALIEEMPPAPAWLYGWWDDQEKRQPRNES
jgi:subtilisin family serine protease/subtilisin-like proprotein convertase family protein